MDATTKLIIDRIDDLKEAHGKRMDNIDQNLAEHMKQTELTRKLHEDNKIFIQTMQEESNTRLKKLEEPGIAMKYLKSKAGLASVLLGLTLAGAKLYDLLRLAGFFNV